MKRMENCKIIENDTHKKLFSKNVNMIFDKRDGFTATWGKTKDEDPIMSPFGPFIADIEITDICRGPGNVPCKFCYKSNTPYNTGNMSFETFKKIIDKLPNVLTQVALGVDAQCESNPDIWKMMKYCRKKGIVPNITVADISDETADKLVEYCGAVACSLYENKNWCYDSLKKLSDRGMKQINIHVMLSKETLPLICSLFEDYLMGEERLKGLNAIVILSLKTKGRGKHFSPVDQKTFTELVFYALEKNIPLGFDSCSAPKFLNSIQNTKYKNLETFVEPCESSLFSVYFNYKGEFFPCSFSEGEQDWKEGISIHNCNDFLEDIWYNKKTINFRNSLIDCGRKCPLFEV